MQKPNDPIKKNLSGPKLKQARLALGLKQEDVAAELEVNYGIKLDRSALGRIERQDRLISDIELFALLKILNLDLGDLVNIK